MANGRPLKPCRVCRKRAGPGDSNRMAIAAASKIGEKQIRPTSETMMSTPRLTACSASDSAAR